MRTWILGLSLSVSFATFAAPTPLDILKRADAIRNPSEGFVMQVRVDSGKKESNVFEVSTEGDARTLIRTLQPSRDVGRDLLMVDDNMWVYIPNLKRAVRVSLSQKLTGEAANGDISRMRWAGDYSAVIEKEDAKHWQLLLTASRKGLTYEKVRAVIEKETFRPLSAEYLTAAGKPLKQASFGEYRSLAGAVRPTSIVIQDSVRTDKKSTIVIEKMQVQKLSKSLFNKKRFETR